MLSEFNVERGLFALLSLIVRESNIFGLDFLIILSVKKAFCLY